MDGVYEFVIAPALHEFASFAFEDICKEFVKELQKKNALPFRYSKMECKFKNTPFHYSEYLDAKAKLTPLKDTAKFYYALFSESGFDARVAAEAENESNVRLYDLNQIVNYK